MQTQKKNTVWIKNAAIVVLALVTAFLGWDTYRNKEHNYQLRAQVTEMESQLNYNEAERQTASEAFSQIESNLAHIRASEGYLMKNLDEEFDGKDNSHARILAEIAAIEQLIGDNRNIISDLENEVGQKDSRLKEYRNSVSSLETRINGYKARTQELIAQSAELKEHLAHAKSENVGMSKELAFSEYMMEAQSEKLAEKNRQLRTVYYVTGPFSFLKELGVAEKVGGILGIAAVKTVTDNLDREDFTAMDMYHYTTIPIYGKNAILLSKHDQNSYDFLTSENGDVRWINIIDPELFWEHTKYLVVETKGAYYEPETAHAD